jgi:glycerol-1-phosphatase
VADPRSLAEAYRGVVCDLDGVVRRGSAAVPYAVEHLTALTAPVVFATNNASLTPEEVARQLVVLGLDVRLAFPAAVVTSSEAGAAHLAAQLDPGSTVLAVGGPGVSAALEAAGLVAVRDTAQGAGQRVSAVLQGYGPDVTARDLAQASYAVQSGARWVATNLDATLPTQDGIAPGNGALVGAVSVATGTSPVAVGKPEPPLYELAVSRLGCASTEALAIGDRLDTDILGAMAAGLDSLWVLTGVDSLVSFATAGGRPAPTFTATDLQALARPAPVVRRVDGTAKTWACGPVRLSVDWGTSTATVRFHGTDGSDGPRPLRAGLGDALASAAVAALVQGRDEEGVAPEALQHVAEQVTAVLTASSS